MIEKKDPSASELRFDFYNLRKEISQTFYRVPEILIKNQDTDLAWLALSIGKFLVWNGPKIDDHGKEWDATVGIKLNTVHATGLMIRDAAVANLEGKNIQISNRAYSVGMDGLREQLDRIEKFMTAGGAK